MPINHSQKHFRLIAPLLLALILSACSLAEDITPPPGSEQQYVLQTQSPTTSDPIYPIVPPDPAKGEAIYIQECAPCHGSTGMGNGARATQLTVPVTAIGSPDVARLSTPAGWFTQITEGHLEYFMPPFPDLSDRQKWDVIAYAYTLSAPEEMVAQGTALYGVNCLRCHGEMGYGDGPDAPSAQNFTDQAFMAGKSGADLFAAITTGMGSNMPAFGDQLGEYERWALTAYLRSLTFVTPSQPPAAETSSPGTTPELTETELPSIETTPDASTQEMTSTVEATSTLATSYTITVEIINGSGGAPFSELEVTLYGFEEMAVAYSETLTTGEDGFYVFQGVEMPVGRLFLAGVDYQGATYGSDILSVETEAAGYTLPTDHTLSVTVYETTTDTSALVIDRVHIFLDFVEADVVQIVELFIFSNPSNKSIIAEEEGGPVLTFSKPEGAVNLEFQDGFLGERYLETPGGFADTMPVPPGMGEYQVLFAFEMPYDRKLAFSQPVDLPIGAIVVLLPDIGVKFKSDMLLDEGIRQAEGMAYHMYTANNVGAGSQLAFNLSGNPSLGGPTLAASDSRTSLAIGLGAFGLALILAGIWLYRRSQLSKEDGDIPAYTLEDDAAPEAIHLDDPDTVIDAIIALDDLFQAGELPEKAHRQRRADLKARLAELIDSGDQVVE